MTSASRRFLIQFSTVQSWKGVSAKDAILRRPIVTLRYRTTDVGDARAQHPHLMSIKPDYNA